MAIRLVEELDLWRRAIWPKEVVGMLNSVPPSGRHYRELYRELREVHQREMADPVMSDVECEDRLLDIAAITREVVRGG